MPCARTIRPAPMPTPQAQASYDATLWKPELGARWQIHLTHSHAQSLALEKHLCRMCIINTRNQRLMRVPAHL